MDILGNESLIDNASRKDFAQNSLVLIVPENSNLNVTSLQDLADPQIEKISIEIQIQSMLGNTHVLH